MSWQDKALAAFWADAFANEPLDSHRRIEAAIAAAAASLLSYTDTPMAEPPITPPPELVRKWNEEAATAPMADQRYIAIQAARWGADQELEACCEWLKDACFYATEELGKWLYEERRSKPPSLKELALEALDRMDQLPTSEDMHTIRRALEALTDD